MRYSLKQNQEQQLNLLLNGGLTFQDNFDGALIEFASTATEQEIQHGLGFVPVGFIVIMIESTGAGPYSVWATRVSEWTTERLFCKSNVSSQRVRLLVV